MKNHEILGFGDMLLFSVIFLVLFKWTGVVSVSWSAVGRFNIFVLTYFIIAFVIDLVIAIIDAIIEKRDE